MSADLARFAIPITTPADPGAWRDDPFLWGIEALALTNGTGVPSESLLRLLGGGPFVFAACVSCCPHWWLGAGKARRRYALGSALGWNITHISADGTQAAYEALLKGPLTQELTFGRALLAYGGWPGEAQYHWGLVTATAEEHRPAGLTPFTGEELVVMPSWPYRLVLADAVGQPVPPIAEALERALIDASRHWDDVVGQEAGDAAPESQWHSGAAALQVLQQRLAGLGPFCDQCTDSSCLSALLQGWAANLKQGSACLIAADAVLQAPELANLARDWRTMGEDLQSAATAPADPGALAGVVERWSEMYTECRARLDTWLQTRAGGV